MSVCTNFGQQQMVVYAVSVKRWSPIKECHHMLLPQKHPRCNLYTLICFVPWSTFSSYLVFSGLCPSM